MSEQILTASPQPDPQTSRHGGERARAGRPKAPISDAVKQVREKMGLSQDRLARELGCSTAALVLMEKQTRLPSKPEVLAKFQILARREGVSLEEQS